MTPDEFRIVEALVGCSFLPGSSQKVFVRQLYGRDRAKRLSERQAAWLWAIAWSWRRQLPPELVTLARAKSGGVGIRGRKAIEEYFDRIREKRGACARRVSMKRGAKVPIALAASFLVSPALIGQPGTYNDCYSNCSNVCNAGPSSLAFGCRMDCINKCMKESRHADSWGAIAYSWKDKINGWSAGQNTKAAAEKMAMDYCVKQGGAKCGVDATFNNTCGALAQDADNFNIVTWGTFGSKGGAQQHAMSECARVGGKKCDVVVAVCSTSGGGTSSTSTNPTPPPPPKAIAWGAIAYSTKDMGAGWSQGKNDRASAEKEAMEACNERGKACVLRTAFNKQCGALAADRDFAGWGADADQRTAQLKAMDECRKAGGTRCVLHVSFCSK